MLGGWQKNTRNLCNRDWVAIRLLLIRTEPSKTVRGLRVDEASKKEGEHRWEESSLNYSSKGSYEPLMYQSFL